MPARQSGSETTTAGGTLNLAARLCANAKPGEVLASEATVHLAAAGGAAGLPIVVWGISRGNQVYRTVNNTPYHYQDNNVSYLFGHTAELIRSGILGLIVGPGVDRDTSMADDSGDNVTNPTPACTAMGRSSGKNCTHKLSTVSDDDGGYLRYTAAAYERNPAARGARSSAHCAHD
jgi:hypothetical protein